MTDKKIEFYPLKDYLKSPKVLSRFNEATIETFDSGQLINGQLVTLFESKFAKQLASEFCITVGSGLDALTLSLRALGVKQGDEVIVPAFTFIATWFCVEGTLATPVPCDVNEKGLLDLDLCKTIITERTKAVIFVHLFGIASDLSSFALYLKERGISLIEDCAQASGAMINNSSVGTFGDVGCFSFYPTKNLGALGDGGAVVTSNKGVAEIIRSYKNYGTFDNKYEHINLGVNSRLDAVQAAWLSRELETLSESNKRRREIAERINNSIGESRLVKTLERDTTSEEDVFHLFVIKCIDERDSILNLLFESNIGFDIHYPKSIVEQKVYQNRNFNLELYPQSIALAKSVVSLPLYPWMDDETLADLCSRLNSIF